MLSAYALVNASNPHLLFNSTNLPYAKHTLVVSNLGPHDEAGAGNAFLFDFLQTTVQIAAAG